MIENIGKHSINTHTGCDNAKAELARLRETGGIRTYPLEKSAQKEGKKCLQSQIS